MLPIYLGPIMLGISASLLFALRLKYPYASIFDLSLIYFTVAILSVVWTFFYNGVVAPAQVTKAVSTVKTLIAIDPSGKLASLLNASNQELATASQYAKMVKDLSKESLSNIKKSGPGLFMYVSAGLAVAFLVLHVVKNIKEHKTPFRPVEALVLAIVSAVSVCPILIYYTIVNRDPSLQKSDMAKGSLDGLKSIINKHLITMWNSDEDLRSGMDTQTDASKQANRLTKDLQGVISELNVIVSSLDALSIDIKSKILGAANSLIAAANALTSELQNTANSPCGASNMFKSNLSKSAGVSSPSALPHLLDFASGVQKLGQASIDSGRSDIDVLLENFVTSCQPVIADLHSFSASDHCNKRERVRSILTSLKGSCERTDQDRLSFLKRTTHNVNGVILLLISIALYVIYLNKTSSSMMFWQPGSVSAIILLTLMYGYLFSDFVNAGKIKSILDIDDPKYFLFLLSNHPS